MRFILLFVCCFSLCTAYSQTIPNADFESWEFNGWLYSPSLWETNNSQVQQDVFQDSAAYSGVLAMQVRPTINTLSSEGMAMATVDIDYIPASLDFQVKFWRTVTASVSVEILFFNGPNYVYGESWFPTDTTASWMPMSIALDQIEPIITHAEIRVGTFVGDFAPGDAWISVDDMSFGTVDHVEEANIEIGIFPNPSAGFVRVQAEVAADQIDVYDLSGTVVLAQVHTGQVDVSGLSAGMYVVVLTAGDVPVAQGRLIVTE
jgi:hypothetical protein